MRLGNKLVLLKRCFERACRSLEAALRRGPFRKGSFLDQKEESEEGARLPREYSVSCDLLQELLGEDTLDDGEERLD